MIVSALWRYPVKSMRGEALDACALGVNGLAGDRRFAIVDGDTGTIASAKYPRKWSALLAATARDRGAWVEIELPGGAHVRTDDPFAAEALSAHLGRAVRISDTPPPHPLAERVTTELDAHPGELGTFELGQGAPGTFFDFAPVHLITTATLRAVDAEAARFRPNLIVDTADPGFVEDAWLGKLLSIGGARLRVLIATPRCVIPTLVHGEHPARPSLLRAIARAHSLDILGEPQPCAGVYALVVRPGRVATGDRVEVIA